MPVNFETMSEFEGGQHLKAYVPAALTSRSGVTVATGVDLGARDQNDLVVLGLPPDLIEKLRPYLGAKGQAAVTLLEEKPLSLTLAEAQTLDAAVKRRFLASLKREYDASLGPGKKRFDSLPSQIQTAIASVAFQYGLNLRRRTPRFWSLITEQDWEGTFKELENFNDGYRSRRRTEAELVKQTF